MLRYWNQSKMKLDWCVPNFTESYHSTLDKLIYKMYIIKYNYRLNYLTVYKLIYIMYKVIKMSYLT